MKHEWRKKEKITYLPKNKPTIIDLKPMNYITVTGIGNPNSDGFKERIGALYAMSYKIKMTLKNSDIVKDFIDYTVYPLEGFWSFTEEGINKYNEGFKPHELKDFLQYKIMIRQPNQITKEIFESFVDEVYNSKKNIHVKDLVFETIEEGLSCQMLHIGSYDDEVASFELMEKYCEENGYERAHKSHKEIYVSDPSRVPVEKLKTTIRFQIKKK